MRRVLSLVITVLFAVQLLLLSASGQVYPEQTVSDGLWRFVVDDAVTYPDDRSLPVVQEERLFFPVDLILPPLGADWQIDEPTRTLSIYRGEQIVAINLLTGQAITSDGRFLITRAFYLNGTYYIVASLALEEFGGKLTLLSNDVYRLTTGSQALTDDEVVALMDSMPSFRPEVVNQPTVYLLFHGTGGGISSILMQFSQHDMRAAFFFSASDIANSPAAVRRIYIAGHRIGIWAPGGSAAEVVRANDLLQKVLKLRTNLVMAPSISTAALERAGYLVWNASFSTASETETLSLSPVLSTVGWPTSVWFDGSSASAQSLEKIFSSISELRLRVASETLRPFQSP